MSTNSPKSWIRAIIVLIAAPLLVTVIGGLIVEWMKPREPKTNLLDKNTASTVGNSATKVSASENPVEKATPPRPILGKWYRTDNGAISIEFMSNDKGIVQNDAGIFPFTFFDNGDDTALFVDGQKMGEVISVANDEIVVKFIVGKAWFGLGSYIERTVRFQRLNPDRFNWIYTALGIFAVIVIWFAGYCINKA